MATLTAGSLLGGYRIEALIGRGSSGAVYRAVDPRRQRLVALKVLSAGASDVPAHRAFERETRWLARCAHPHIAAVFEAGQDHGLDFIAMELMATTIAGKLASGPVNLRDVPRLGTQILDGLAGAHRQGIVHRDVKPANVGIALDGEVKLLDFGVAAPLATTSPLDTMTAEGLSFVGTLHYMSPEQLRGEEIDERADVYSAGAVLYEMVCGHRPFQQPQPACLIDAVLNRMPVPPSERRPEISPRLEHTIIRALAKAPGDRYRTANAMAEALGDDEQPMLATMDGLLGWPFVGQEHAL